MLVPGFDDTHGELYGTRVDDAHGAPYSTSDNAFKCYAKRISPSASCSLFAHKSRGERRGRRKHGLQLRDGASHTSLPDDVHVRSPAFVPCPLSPILLSVPPLLLATSLSSGQLPGHHTAPLPASCLPDRLSCSGSATIDAGRVRLRLKLGLPAEGSQEWTGERKRQYRC